MKTYTGYIEESKENQIFVFVVILKVDIVQKQQDYALIKYGVIYGQASGL